ncbi:MAG TPA: hypothetical protein VEI02_06255 [Planctomycetota bacterium]|nr:hypothetical protein [Planctomycetota bacterium]
MTRSLALSLVCALAGTAAAQNCSQTSVGLTPLNDLGTGTYQGFVGGLYPGGANVAPPTHAAAGAALAATIVPRLADGSPAPPAAPGGRIVLVALGMSNATQEFSTFVQTSNADVHRAPPVRVVDAAQGGIHAGLMADPMHPYWNVVSTRLAQAGVTESQVQAVWIKNAHASPTLGFPAHATALKDDLRAIVQNARLKFPNLRLAFLSSRTYGGYAAGALNPEPYAYESGFAVKWLIEDQIAGDPALNFDPSAGPVVAPWLAWGPYLWADGLVPRSDGLTWECRDFAADGVHPAPLGRFEVAERLHAFFHSEPTAAPWYATANAHPVPAALYQYGEPAPGANGPLALVGTGGPELGTQFNGLGVANAPPNALAVVFLATGYDDLALSGAHVYVDLNTIFLPAPGLFSGFTTNANGFGLFSLGVPNIPALMGLNVYAQIAVADPGAAAFPELGGLALTRGIRLVLGT